MMIVTMASVALAGLAASAGTAATSPLIGTWANSKASVLVRTELCGSSICGRVVWANEHAREDAREGGVKELVGTQVLRGFTRSGPKQWRGVVFVPEKGRTFTSRITQIRPDEINVQGCVLAGLLCAGEKWTRRQDQNASAAQ